MVSTETVGTASANRFLIRPNSSLSWKDAVRFYLGMVFVSFTIAIFCVLNGAWPVLPFAGLEMLVLGIALYKVAHRCAYWQVVEVSEDQITVFDSLAEASSAVIFQRAWASVVLEHAGSWYSPRLFIRSHGKDVEIGNCLTAAEREQLAFNLENALRVQVAD
ncbi:MAG: DUF2244 domain-containing protein [Gammaproteobacteria bacterium]